MPNETGARTYAEYLAGIKAAKRTRRKGADDTTPSSAPDTAPKRKRKPRKPKGE